MFWLCFVVSPAIRVYLFLLSHPLPGDPDRSAIVSTERQAIKPSPIELNQFP